MLDRRGWFIALGPRIGCLVEFQTDNWVPKTNLAGKKKTNLATKTNLAGVKNLLPDKNYLDWNEFCTYLLLYLDGYTTSPPPFLQKEQVFTLQVSPPFLQKERV